MAKVVEKTDGKNRLHTLRDGVKVTMGLALMTALPERKKRMQKLATIPWHMERQPDAIDRLIRAALFWQNSRDSSGQKLASLHQEFWRNQPSNAYYEGTKDRFSKVFLPNFSGFLPELAQQMQAHQIDKLVEIGCGDGQLLRYLQQQLPAQQFVGLDLSEDQIKHNNATRDSDGPRYYSGDASEWIQTQANSHTAFVTGLGVLEYFTQTQLEALLTHIASQLTPSVALFTEPVDPDADFDSFDQSYTVGEEHSFSHNYPRRLKECGWQLVASHEVPVGDYRWMVYIATC